MDTTLDRKLWVFCGRPCRLQWESNHCGEFR
jgi:hypothetical protein